MRPGGLDEPDLALDRIQAGARIDVWLAGAVPGNMTEIRVDQPDCQALVPSPSMAGMLFPGQRRVEVQSLTVADLFFN